MNFWLRRYNHFWHLLIVPSFCFFYSTMLHSYSVWDALHSPLTCFTKIKGKSVQEYEAFEDIEKKWLLIDEKVDFHTKVHDYFALLKDVFQDKRLSSRNVQIIASFALEEVVEVLKDQHEQLLACKQKLNEHPPLYEAERSIQLQINGMLDIEIEKIQEVLNSLNQSIKKSKGAAQTSALKVVVPVFSAILASLAVLGIIVFTRSSDNRNASAGGITVASGGGNEASPNIALPQLGGDTSLMSDFGGRAHKRKYSYSRSRPSASSRSSRSKRTIPIGGKHQSSSSDEDGTAAPVASVDGSYPHGGPASTNSNPFSLRRAHKSRQPKRKDMPKSSSPPINVVVPVVVTKETSNPFSAAQTNRKDEKKNEHEPSRKEGDASGANTLGGGKGKSAVAPVNVQMTSKPKVFSDGSDDHHGAGVLNDSS